MTPIAKDIEFLIHQLELARERYASQEAAYVGLQASVAMAERDKMPVSARAFREQLKRVGKAFEETKGLVGELEAAIARAQKPPAKAG